MIEVHKVPIIAPDFQTNGPLPNFKGFYPSNGKVFVAKQQAGTGASQNIAHGLGAVPAVVLAIPTDGGTVVYGTHTSTNVVVTVTSGKKFDVVAWL
jgi:formylmethanofuran:tetrahydromethanopterin formyltransferase